MAGVTDSGFVRKIEMTDASVEKMLFWASTGFNTY